MNEPEPSSDTKTETFSPEASRTSGATRGKPEIRSPGATRGKPEIRFRYADLGCWADGCLGNDHVREVMAGLVERAYKGTSQWGDLKEVFDALKGDMSDDAWEEDEALDALNELCVEGIYFERYGGDLLLSRVDENE